MQSLRQNFENIFRYALDKVLPPRCVVNGDVVDEQGMISPRAWADLNFIADPFCRICGFPFEFDAGDALTCTSCLEHPPPFKKARAALRYDDVSRDLILGFKHADKTHVVKAFVPWLRKAGSGFLDSADYLVPVPLHPWRLIKRRYNQAAVIAYALKKEAGLAVLPDALHRIRATPSQGHLTAKERYKNVRRAFDVPQRRSDIKGKTIVLIDDVYTTGATVKECAKALQKAGAGQVYVLTLARVVRPGFD